LNDTCSIPEELARIATTVLATFLACIHRSRKASKAESTHNVHVGHKEALIAKWVYTLRGRPHKSTAKHIENIALQCAGRQTSNGSTLTIQRDQHLSG